MAVRPYWKGYLKLSLVTCPVQMMPATSENHRRRFPGQLPGIPAKPEIRFL